MLASQSKLFSLLALLLLSCKVESFSVAKVRTRQRTTSFLQHTSSQHYHTIVLHAEKHKQQNEKRNTYGITTESPIISRRILFVKSIGTVVGAVVTNNLVALPAVAKDVTVSPDEIKAAFDAVRKELNGGGIPYMSNLIDTGNTDELLEFTKTYDQILRKGVMGKAKKMLLNDSDKALATQLANNVTFDLIGINKSCRPGQTNQQQAMSYLNELMIDVEKFLSLQPTQ